MVQIKAINIHAFRGIPDLELRFDGKNLVLKGENATGKSSIVEAFELKSHGFYNQPNIERVKFAFETIEKAWSAIKLFYVTFRETNYYDRKARIIFGKSPKWYYRLSDSGDGVQLPPKSYFPHEWNRMVGNLSALKQL